MKEKAIARVYECCKIANIELPSNISFDLKGAIGGTAYVETRELKLNLQLLEENFDEYMSQIIPHEVAHLVQFDRHGLVYYRGKKSWHGPVWKSIMVNEFGAKPDAYHNLKVTKTRTYKKYAYECSCKEWLFTTIRHNRSQKHGGKWYTCPTCKGSITWKKKAA